MIFYVLNKDDVLVETIQSPDESGVSGITTIQGIVEEKLSTYELMELIVPADSDGLEDIEEEMTVVFKDISGWREYIIYEIEDIDGDSLETSIRAELSSSELIDEVIERDIRGISNNPTRNLEEILEGTRWLAGQVDSSLYSQPLNIDTNYMNVLEALNEYATRYGAEIRFRYEVDGNKVVRRYVDAYKQFGEFKGKIFEIDRDMTSVKRTVNTELIKTTIIPYSKELEEEYPEGEEPETKETYRIGIEDIEWKKSNGDPADKPLGQNYLVDPVALERWGKLNADGSRRHKKIPMEFDLDNAEAIISMAWVQLGRYTQPRVSYEVSAIDLYAMTGDEDLKHEQILLGDTGGVKDHYFSNPLEIQTRLVEVKRDLFDPRNNDYVFGDPRTIFSANASVEVAEEMAKDMEDVITRIENAQISIDGKTKVFRGSEVPVNPEENDIWFRPHPSKQGHTQMMLFNGATWEIHVDSSDLEDAGRLTFGTLDGAEINVINLIADNITGGQLKLENGIEITHKGIPILRVNNSGEVEMNVSKMTINALDMEAELERIQALEDGKDAYELAVENGFVGTMEDWLESLKGTDGSQGPQGVQGPAGKDGKATYTWIKYADTSTGGGISNSPTGKEYIGLAHNQSSATESDTPTDYTWSLIRGPQGETGNRGVEGPKGKDGETTYTWIKYSANANGSGLTDTPQANTAYIGIATNKSTEAESNTPSEYTWTLFKGPKGETGEQGPRGLQGQQGPEGKQGIQGLKGTDGESTYTHIAYSTSKTGANFSHSTFDTATYIGMYVSNESDSSDSPSDYEWTLIKGKDGSQGLRGPVGPNGLTPYFHTAWANSADGVTGFSTTVSTNKLYIGTATTFESDDPTAPSAYDWTKIKGDKGDIGDTGPQGAQGATGAKGATGSQGPRGATGTSVESVTEYYLATSASSGIVASDTRFTTAIQTMTATNKYLWNYEEINFSDNTSQPTIPVIIGVYGDKGQTGATGGTGATGRSITSITEHYLATSASTGVTRTTSGWGTTMKTTTETNKYLWNYETINWSSGTTPTYVDPIIIGVHGAKGPQGSQGPQGPQGISPIVGFLTNESITLPASSAGAVSSFTGATGTFEVYDGTTRKTGSGISYSVSGTPSGITVAINATTGVYTVSAMTTGTSVLSGTATLRAVYGGVTVDKILTVTKALAGTQGGTGATGATGDKGATGPAGQNATSYWINASVNAIKKDVAGVIVPKTITFSGFSKTGTANPVAYAGRFIIQTSTNGTSYTTRYTSSANQSSYTYTIPATAKFVKARYYLAGGTTVLLDEQTIPVLVDAEGIEVGGRNLLVQHTITEGGYLTVTGAVTASATWFYTDYIPVTEGTKLITSGYTNLGSAPSVVYYDADKAFVKGINNAGASKAKEITIDSGIAYIRFSGIIADLPTLKIEKGNIATDWTEAPEDTQEKLDEKADTDLIDNIQNQLDDFILVEGYETEIGEINQALQEYKELIESGEVATEEAVSDITALLDRTVLIENNLGEFTESWNFDVSTITMGEEGLFLGDNLTDMGIRISPQVGDTPPRIDFMDNGTIVAEITGQYMKINRGIFVKSAKIGEHQIETIAGGHTIWQWIPSTP